MKKIILPNDPEFNLIDYRMNIRTTVSQEPMSETDREWLAQQMGSNPMLTNTATTGTWGTGRALTAENVRESIAKMSAEIKAIEARYRVIDFNWNTLQVHESPFAFRKTNLPRKVHIRRWYQTKKYHLKAQAKFNEEFGYMTEPCVYMVNPQALHPEQRSPHYEYPYLIAHPTLYKRVCDIIYNRDSQTLTSLVNRFDSSYKDTK